MKTTISILKPEFSVTKEQYVISLLCKGPRENGRKGLVGLILIEGIDNDENYFMIAIGRHFGLGLNNFHEIYKIDVPLSVGRDDVLKLIGYGAQKNIKGLIPKFYYKSQNVAEDSWTIAASRLAPYLDKSQFRPLPTNLGAIDYSFNKAVVTLQALGRPLKFLKLDDSNKELQPRVIELNPFKRLIETSTFSAARFRRSDLKERIKDVFKVLHGNRGTWNKNKLGVLDYLLPFPRLLWNLSIFLAKKSSKQPKLFSLLFSIAAVCVAIPAVVLMGVKFLAAALLTAAALILVVAPFHLIMLPFAKDYKQQINSLRLRKIKTEDCELDCIDDLQEKQDLEEEKTFAETFSTADMKKMLIKPLSKNEQSQFSLTPKQLAQNVIMSTDKKYDVKYLGLYNKEGTPKAIVEVNYKNYWQLYSAMKTNMFKINNNLEKIGTMPTEMYSTVFPQVKKK